MKNKRKQCFWAYLTIVKHAQKTKNITAYRDGKHFLTFSSEE